MLNKRIRRRAMVQILLCLWLMGSGSLGASDTLCATSAPPEGSRHAEMTVFKAVILGAVEGLTEYLPVSSTGHLLLAQRAMGLDGRTESDEGDRKRAKEASDAYAICIQAGAILAVLGLYFPRVKQMVLGLLGKDSAGLQMVFNVAAGFLPAVVIGLLFEGSIKKHLFGLWPVVIAWFAGGAAILVISRRRKSGRRNLRLGWALEELDIRMALMIGLAQCVAMWPGVSRSLVTIVGGLMVGLSMPAALEFSFILGMVTLTAATGYDALKHGAAMLQLYSPTSLAVGLVSAWLFAVVSVQWMVSYLNRHGLELFGYYRVAAAITVGSLLLLGLV